MIQSTKTVSYADTILHTGLSCATFFFKREFSVRCALVTILSFVLNKDLDFLGLRLCIVEDARRFQPLLMNLEGHFHIPGITSKT